MRVVAVPKSVKLLVLVDKPTGILFPFPLKVSVEVGCAVVVKLLAIAPGLTQLDIAPVRAKLVRVK